MNQKVKAKIEAMAEENASKSVGSFDELGLFDRSLFQEHRVGYIDGATPWAEWCERFEETFWHCEKVCEEIGSYPDDMIELLKEYRTWLEER